MPASTEPNSGIKYGWDLGESGWNLEMDSNLKKIGRVMQLSVIDRDLTAPPASPADGDRYIIAAGATGDWAGHDNKVAVWEAAASAWIVYAPFKGWVGYVEDEDVAVRYDGTAWQSYSLANADTVDGKHAADFEPAGLADFAQDTATTSGLTLGYEAGAVRNGTTVSDVAAGTVPLTANARNYVEITGAGVVSANTTGFTVGRVPLFEVVTDASAITGVTDRRAWLSVGGGASRTMVSRTGSVQALTSSTFTKVQFNTVEWDDESEWDSVNHRWVASRAGVVDVSAFVHATVADGANFAVELYKNGASFKRLGEQVPGNQAAGQCGSALTVDVEPGDYLEVFVFTGASSPVVTDTTSSALTYFSIRSIKG